VNSSLVKADRLYENSKAGIRLILVDSDDVIAAEGYEKDVGREAVEPVFSFLAVRFGFTHFAEGSPFGREDGVFIHADQHFVFPDGFFEFSELCE